MEPREYKLGTWEVNTDSMASGVEITGGDNPLVQNPHASCTGPHDGKSVGAVALRMWPGLAAMVVIIAY